MSTTTYAKFETIQVSIHNICFYKEVDTNTWAEPEYYEIA